MLELALILAAASADPNRSPVSQEADPEAIVMTGGRSIIADDFVSAATGTCNGLQLSIVQNPGERKVNYYFRVNGENVEDVPELTDEHIGTSPLRFYIRCDPHGNGEVVTLGGLLSGSDFKLVESKFRFQDRRVVPEYMDRLINTSHYWRWLDD